MRNKVRAILAAATSGIIGLFSQNTQAQQINYTAGTYTQDFNALPNTGLTGTTAFANATGPFDLTQATPNGIGAGAAMTGWYAGQITGANPLKLYTTDGSNVQTSIGGVGSFGAAGDSERSLGSFSNTGAQARFGAKFVNTSTTTFTTFTIDYDVEQWAQSATTIDFLNRLEYGIGATTLNTGTYTVIGPTDTAAGGGSWNSLITGAATQTLNGNDPANQTHKTFTIDGIAWVPGQSLFFRWNDVNDAGTEAALAIDNFNFTAASVGNILAWKGTPNGTWDTNTANQPWLNGATAASFNNNDIVTFGDIASNAAITVDVGGVSPGSTTFTHASKTYTFSGGPIAGPMTMSGAGKVVFTVANNFTAVNLNAGTVELQTNNALGFGSTVSLGNAVINITTTDHTFSNPLVITGSGTINTSVPLIINGSVNGVAGTKLTINNTSATFVELPNLVGGASNYAGDFHVAGGVVKYTGATDGDLFSATTIVTVDVGATLDFGVNGDSFGGLQGGGNVILTNTPGSFLNLQAAGDRTFSGIISGTTVNAATLGLHQQGGGVFTLTGKNTFKAPTTISFGTIVVGGNVLPDTDGPLGNSSTAIQLGDGGASTSNVVGLIISGAFEVARPITILPNTNTVTITLGGNTDANSLFSGPIDMGKSPRFTSVTTGTNAVTFSGPILASGTNSHGITKIGTGLVILSNPNNTFLNPVTINEGTLRVTGSIATSAGVIVNTGGIFEAGATQTVQTLTVNAGGKAKVLSGVLTVGGNSTNAGVIDLTTRGLIFDYPAGSETLALQGIRAQIISGYNASAPGAGNGDWKGNGITSTSITSSKAIGYAQATDITLGAGNTFMGAPVPDTTAILARFTFAGDANLDGAVDFSDLVALAQHYGQSDGNALWTQGDFNYDGNVGFADLVSIAQNYGAVLPASAIPSASPNFAPDLAAAFASVPEPSAISLVALSAAPLLRRRRR